MLQISAWPSIVDNFKWASNDSSNVVLILRRRPIMQRITVAHGDGIGPEIMAATLHILEKAGASLAYDTIEIGEQVYLKGNSAGIAESSWETLLKNKVFLKAPITTPQGGGFKSLNVTVRKGLGLYANVRPCQSYSPFVQTKHPLMDVVIVRENEEDLYAGIEHRQSYEVYQCLKLISRPGCEKIVRYAFEYARSAGRKKVTCFTKDNIMKMTDGLFHKVFDEIGANYPELEKEHWIIDIGAAKMADTPEAFDVIVMANLYGDILSDVAAQIAGSVGLAGSSNIGEHGAMFEAIHGSAPRRAGQNMANPSGLLLGAVQMLVHMGQGQVASKIHNAWLKTIEDGVHTYDIFRDASKKKVGTKEFAEEVAARLGEQPSTLKSVAYASEKPMELFYTPSKIGLERPKKDLAGIDVFICEDDRNSDNLAQRINAALKDAPIELEFISNRGTKVWPKGRLETFKTDHWRCRMQLKVDGDRSAIWAGLKALHEGGLDVIKTENLYNFDGQPGYSASH